MGDAFLCDFCRDYKDGEPCEKLYRKEHIDRQGTDVIHVADVCEICWDYFGLREDKDDE